MKMKKNLPEVVRIISSRHELQMRPSEFGITWGAFLHQHMKILSGEILLIAFWVTAGKDETSKYAGNFFGSVVVRD
jgi:hypothetical protein